MTPTRSSWRRYAGFAAFAVLLTVAVAAAGYVPTQRLAGEAGVQAMLVAWGICLVASLVGSLPIALVRPGPAPSAVQAVFVSMALRLLLVLGATLAVALGQWVAKAPLLIWVAIGYVTLLVADTWYATGAVRSAAEGHRPADDPAKERTITEQE